MAMQPTRYEHELDELRNCEPDQPDEACGECLECYKAKWLDELSKRSELQRQLSAGAAPASAQALRELASKWCAAADAEDARLKQYCYGGELDGDMLDEDIARGFAVNDAKRKCAFELEAALAASPGGSPQE